MHVVDFLGLAGMEAGVIKVVNRLDRARFAPSICCLRQQGPETRDLLAPDVPVHALDKPEGRDLKVILRLAGLLRRERVDVVHSHNWPTFLFTWAAARLAGVPVVIHGEHGHESSGRQSRRRLFVRSWLGKRVTRLTAVARDLAREIVETWGIAAERVTVIVNGVDLARFDVPHPVAALRRELSLPEAARVVLTVGGLRPVKDLPTAIRGLARLLRSVPDARLVVVGSNWTGLQPELESLARALGVADRVIFAGLRHDVPALLALCDVYVNSSRFEGMSNTILEAMTAARPVVATRVGGNPELVTDGVSGFLVPVGDDLRLAERLEQILRDPALAARMGAAGRRRVEREHRLDGMVGRYADLYEETLGRHEASRRPPARERAKRWAARGLSWSGLTRLGAGRTAGRLAVLMYHRVLPLREAAEYPRQGMVMPRDLFEAQVAHLARRYHVLPMPEAVRRLAEGSLPERAVVLTFDDGYRDNHEQAWPILARFGVPATFFVVTGAIDGTHRLWWDEVTELTARLHRSGRWREAARDGLAEPLAAALGALGAGASVARVADRSITVLWGRPAEERRTALGALRRLAGGGDSTDLMMSWDQVRDLHEGGMYIGSHTVSHAFFDELDEPTATREVEESIGRLREEIPGAAVTAFSYPRGRLAERLRPVLTRAGIEVAVTTQPGLNARDADRLELKRLDAGYCRAQAGFDAATFDAELSGWFRRGR
jgi:sugar transferase (PEP-CTERM/EpsH1 system associated)